MASRISIIRRKVALGQYELTGHAKDEMEQDGFSVEDVKSCVYSGRIVERQRHDGGRRKDVIHGKACDRRGIGIVCRLTDLGVVRFITIFAL